MTGPVKLPLSSGIADAQALRRGDELLGEAVDHGVRHEDAARRNAALAARLEGANDRRVHRQIEPASSQTMTALLLPISQAVMRS